MSGYKNCRYIYIGHFQPLTTHNIFGCLIELMTVYMQNTHNNRTETWLSLCFDGCLCQLLWWRADPISRFSGLKTPPSLSCDWFTLSKCLTMSTVWKINHYPVSEHTITVINFCSIKKNFAFSVVIATVSAEQHHHHHHHHQISW